MFGTKCSKLLEHGTPQDHINEGPTKGSRLIELSSFENVCVKLSSMATLTADEKRYFVVATSNEPRLNYYIQKINEHISNSLIFTAGDGFEAIFKMENTPPHVLIVDMDLPKLNGTELATKVLAHSKLNSTSIIVVSPIPEKEQFVDQVVTGQVQFLTDIQNDGMVAACLTRALNRLTDDESLSYKLKFLAPQETLFREGDHAECVYIVRRGELHAYKGNGMDAKVLGTIVSGEFVGEMAHINGEPRSATVRSLTDCELIEIPMGTLDTVLFSKPAWSKALVSTLSRRLKKTNNALAEEPEK